MDLNFLTNVRCMMFRGLTQFDALLGFGGNAHFLPIRVSRSPNLWFTASYSQVFTYQCFHQTFESR